jgi:thiol-disulfide isomerase/thioredoxin
MSGPVRSVLFRGRLRWAAPAVLIVLAAVVALWPRASAVEPRTPMAAPLTVLTPSPEPDLASMRAAAALDPCPSASRSASASGMAGPLASVTVPCLGSEGTVPLGAALAGHDTLLNIWSHTCEPCRDELPALQDYARQPGAVAVLGVQVDGSPQAGLALLTALRVRLPSVSDPDGVLRAALSAPPVLPLTYLVAGDGSVRMVNPPVVFRSPDEVRAAVAKYLGAAR